MVEETKVETHEAFILCVGEDRVSRTGKTHAGVKLEGSTEWLECWSATERGKARKAFADKTPVMVEVEQRGDRKKIRRIALPGEVFMDGEKHAVPAAQVGPGASVSITPTPATPTPSTVAPAEPGLDPALRAQIVRAATTLLLATRAGRVGLWDEISAIERYVRSGERI